MSTCGLSWCADHLIEDDLVAHASIDLVVQTAALPGDRFAAHVLVERDDPDEHAGVAHVRLELDHGGGIPSGGPMTPDEALELSRVLRRAALVAGGQTRRFRLPVYASMAVQ